MDGKDPASGGLVDCDSDLIPARPVRDIGIRANAPNVFFVRDNLKVVRIHATSISAQMVKLKAIWNGAVKLFPKPDVAEAQPPVAAHSSVTVSMSGAHFPAAGFWIYLVRQALPVARIVHLWFSNDVSQFRLFGDGRIESTTTEAFSSPSDAGDGDFVMSK
jgi:hypothetical protein